MCDYALKLFQFGQEMAKERGLILVDTKYEFGCTRANCCSSMKSIHQTVQDTIIWMGMQIVKPKVCHKSNFQKNLLESG